MVDVKVKPYDGSYHEVSSSEATFKVATPLALKNTIPKAGATTLESIVKAQVITPGECLGGAMGSITARHGNMDGIEDRSGAKVLDAMVPLSEMFDHTATLHSSTQGCGTFTMVLDRHSPVPKSIQEEIIEKHGGNVE